MSGHQGRAHTDLRLTDDSSPSIRDENAPPRLAWLSMALLRLEASPHLDVARATSELEHAVSIARLGPDRPKTNDSRPGLTLRLVPVPVYTVVLPEHVATSPAYSAYETPTNTPVDSYIPCPGALPVPGPKPHASRPCDAGPGASPPPMCSPDPLSRRCRCLEAWASVPSDASCALFPG